jgi:transcriptional regulator with XRE-family HTH domain
MGTIGEVFGTNVRRLRKKRGWSIERLSEMAGISPASLKNYEAGKVPEGPIVPKLAAALEVDEVRLFQLERPLPPTADEALEVLREALAIGPRLQSAPPPPTIPPNWEKALTRAPKTGRPGEIFERELVALVDRIQRAADAVQADGDADEEPHQR